MLARRLLILLAVLMAMTALAAGLAPRQPVPRDAGRAERATPPALPPAEEEAGVVEETVSADPGARVRRIVAEPGELVRLTVEGQVVDSVELGDLRVEPIDPVSPALFELLADEPGLYPITLLDAQRTLAVLEVRED